MDDEQIGDDARSPRRSKKTVIVAGLAVLFALGMGIAATLFLRANSLEEPEPRESTVVNGHEILPTITGHDPKDPFIVEFTEEGRERVQEKLSDDGELEDLIAAYIDEEFTQRASSHLDWPVDGVHIDSLEQSNVPIVDSRALKDYRDEMVLPISAGDYKEWGLYETYYVVQHVDEDGEDLETPLVQPYTLDIDRLAPVESLEVSDPDDEGNVEFSWDPVEGAESYLIVQTSYITSTGYHNYMVVGETTDPSWASVEALMDFDLEHYSRVGEAQNDGLVHFYTHEEFLENVGRYDRDEIDETNELLQGHAVGVIATDGKRFSHYIPQDVSEELGSLPHRHADVTWEDRFDIFTKVSLTELKDLTMPYVTLDGSVEETVMQVDPDAEIDTSRVISLGPDDSGEPVTKDRDTYKVPVHGVGTMLSREINVEITDDPIEDQIDEFNKAQLELAEELGIATD